MEINYMLRKMLAFLVLLQCVEIIRFSRSVLYTIHSCVQLVDPGTSVWRQVGRNALILNIDVRDSGGLKQWIDMWLDLTLAWRCTQDTNGVKALHEHACELFYRVLRISASPQYLVLADTDMVLKIETSSFSHLQYQWCTFRPAMFSLFLMFSPF